MRVLRGIGLFFWRFMVVFSFIVNIILVVVLLVLGLLIFEIKNEIAQPLVTGLHSSFVGLDNATIDWTIPVRDEIQVRLDIPLETNTVVVLTEPVPLQVNALIDLPGINAYNVNASVNLQLPAGLELPVALDLDVAVDQPLPVALDVRAVIPLQETQLHDVAENLRLLFEPLARGLHNLPSDFKEAGQLAGDVLRGDLPNLLVENDYSLAPWPGYSVTAGLGYDLYTEPVPLINRPVETGIVTVGGIPALDEQLRPEIYEAGGPEVVNQQAKANLEARNVPPVYYNGGIGDVIMTTLQQVHAGQIPGEAVGGPDVVPPPGGDMGIIPTPNPDMGILPPSDEGSP